MPVVGHDRYRLLDELRGVAAVCVLIFHIGTHGIGPVLLNHGYFAVDFFFMLSGFVIAEAYEQRLSRDLSLAGFATRRLIRMAPVAMLGTLIGGAYLVARAFVAPHRSDSLPEVLGGNLLNLLMLPKLWPGRATGWNLFPANGPLWSLFFEIAVNLAWAAFLAGRGTRFLAVVVAASAGLLVACGLHFGTLHLGWEATSFVGGIARVSYGFGAGLLLHRARGFLPVMDRRAAVIALTALVLVLALPVIRLEWELAVALVCLPAVLALAVTAGRTAVLPGGALLGRLSYPLYAIHSPLIAIMAGALKHGGAAGVMHSAGLLLVPVLLAVSHVALVRFDEPVRARLTRRLLATTASSRPDVQRAAPQRPEIAPRGMPGTETGSEVNLSPGDEAAVRDYAPTEFA